MASPIESRIKNIQKSLKVTQTGVFDMATCKAFELLQSVNVTSATLTDHLKAIQKFLGFTGKDVDGIYGVATISRIEQIFDTTVPTLPLIHRWCFLTKASKIFCNGKLAERQLIYEDLQTLSGPKNRVV